MGHETIMRTRATSDGVHLSTTEFLPRVKILRSTTGVTIVLPLVLFRAVQEGCVASPTVLVSGAHLSIPYWQYTVTCGRIVKALDAVQALPESHRLRLSQTLATMGELAL